MLFKWIKNSLQINLKFIPNRFKIHFNFQTKFIPMYSKLIRNSIQIFLKQDQLLADRCA